MMHNELDSIIEKHGKKNPSDNEQHLVEYTGTEADSEDSKETDTADDTVTTEKDSFDKKVLEQSSSKSFFEDNPFQIQDTDKSIFANRLSLTPHATRPATSATQSASTPKRQVTVTWTCNWHQIHQEELSSQAN